MQMRHRACPVARPVAKASGYECHGWARQIGPQWIRAGWVEGYKLWVGDLPDSIGKKDIGHYCAGHIGVAVQRGKATSGMAYAIVTFTDLALANKAFEQLAMVKFDHGEGPRFWANVKWFAGRE